MAGVCRTETDKQQTILGDMIIFTVFKHGLHVCVYFGKLSKRSYHERRYTVGKTSNYTDFELR